MSNYRPISLLSSFSKVFQRVIYNRLKVHIHSNILAKKQNGFRTNSPTELANYNLTNNILTTLGNKLLAVGVSCDLTKAYDCVKHDKLLAKIGLLWY